MKRLHRITIFLVLSGLMISALVAWFAWRYQLDHMEGELRFRAQGHALAIRHQLAQALRLSRDALRSFRETDNAEDIKAWGAIWGRNLAAAHLSHLRIFSEDGTQRWPATTHDDPLRTWSEAPQGIRCEAGKSLCRLHLQEGSLHMIAAVDMAAVVESGLKQTPTGGFHVRLEQRTDTGWQPVYTHFSRTGAMGETPLPDVIQPFVVSGGAWRTVNTAVPAFLREFPLWMPWITFGVLALVTLLAGLLVERELALRDASVQLAESHRRRIVAGRAMLDAIGIPISLIRNDFTYERVNRAFAEMHGVGDVEAIEWRKVHEIWGEETFDREILPHLKRALRGETVEREFTHPIDGEDRLFRVTMYPFYRDGAQEGVVVVTRDVTDQIRAEEERRALMERETRQQHLQEIGLLAGGIAHDINNMLAIIVGETELALMEAGECGAETIGRHMQQVMATSERAGRLCKQLLAYAGKSVNIPRCLKPQALLNNLAPMLRLAAGRKVRMDVEVSVNAPPFFADQGQIEQLLLNLVINAADAVSDRPDGHIRLRCKGEKPEPAAWQSRGLATPAHVLRIDVSDNGEGIDESLLPCIFEPFFTTKAGGSGMGLAAVKGIVETLNGMIDVSSAPGEGTTFTIRIPAEDCANDCTTGEMLACALEEASQSNDDGDQKAASLGRILLADDEDGVRTMACTALERLGLEVLAVADGKAAVEAFAENQDRIDVVMLDVTMPEMDGIQAAQAIRAMRPDVPIMLCSGYQEDAQPEDGFRPDAFLHKPYRLGALAQTIQELLERREADDS